MTLKVIRYMYFLGILLCCNTNMFAQARLILNNNAIMTMDNGIYLVINNSNGNAITTAGTGGNIISEDENNRVRWTIGTSTGNYTVPFTSAGLNKIPVTIQISTAGVGSGSFEFATYGGATWDNNTYRPSIVTNMTNDITFNNSAEVIDRFWLISTPGYTTKPSGTIDFTYIDAEHTAVGNSINEADLKAERYYTPTNSWDQYAPIGAANTATNVVEGVTVSAANFVSVWTLIDQTAHPLPITLVDFNVDCVNDGVEINWSTATENNASSFIISRSADGVQFYPIATIPAVGYSTEMLYYDYFIKNGSGYYYQLQLVNDDLSLANLGVGFGDCGQITEPVFYVYTGAPHQFNAVAQNLPDGEYQLSLLQLSGELCHTENVHVTEGTITATYYNAKLATGIYLVMLTDNKGIRFVEKVLLRD